MSFTLVIVLKVLAGLVIVGACLVVSLYHYAQVEDKK